MAAETSTPATTAPPAAEAPRVRNLVFRLDDGTIIRRTGDRPAAEVLRPKEAWEAGMLNEHHLLHMQGLLCQIHSKLPEEGPLKSVSDGSKRSMDSVLEINQTQSVKKARSSDGGFIGNGTAHFGAHPTPSSATLPFNWVDTAKRFIDTFLKRNNKETQHFLNPVNPKVVIDYYEKIKQPMSFSEIKEKLDAGSYTSSKEFYEDILLIWDNCHKYNVECHPSDFALTGWDLEKKFQQAWAKSPLAAEVPARQMRLRPDLSFLKPAGQPAAARRGTAAAGGGARQRPGRPPGVSRTKSVNSYGSGGGVHQHHHHQQQHHRQQHPVWTSEMQAALLNALQDEVVLNKYMQQVIEILQAANEMGVDEDGEATLDMEKITPVTAWKLYNLVVGKPPAKSTGRSPLLDDEDEDDYDPEEEDDD